MSGGLVGFNPRTVDSIGYSEEELHGRTCSCGTRYMAPGGCPDCAVSVRLDFKTRRVEVFPLGRRIGEDPAAPLLRLCTLLDEASRDLQQQAAGAAHDKSEVFEKLAGIEALVDDARRQYEDALRSRR